MTARENKLIKQVPETTWYVNDRVVGACIFSNGATTMGCALNRAALPLVQQGLLCPVHFSCFCLFFPPSLPIGNGPTASSVTFSLTHPNALCPEHSRIS